MRTGLLTIFAVAISAVLTSGNLYASEPTSPAEGAAEVAASPQDAAPAPAAAVPASAAPAADSAAVAATDTAEPADAAAMPQADANAATEASAGTDSAVGADAAASDAESSDSGAEVDTASASAESDSASEAQADDAASTRKVALGKIGYDEQGRAGRIHIVVPGDTLWDISDAYLGTPWVWPSIWTDNRNIENPHLIIPGDRIWISAYEMRRVTSEEAERLLAGQPKAADAEPAASGPASDSFQSLVEDDGPSNIVHVASLESTGLISAEQLDAAASIVDAITDRVMLSQGDRVYIGLGEGQASVGDQFTVFRAKEKVYDPSTNRLLGYHIEMLGWVEIIQTDAEASLGEVRMSDGEMGIGDRVMPRERPIHDVEVVASPKNVDGQISFFPSNRVLMGPTDFVYLNRGELDGLEVGSPLEVYRGGWNAPEPARATHVDVPDHVIADLLVVRARPQSAVALVRRSETELQLGDHFRGAGE
jgi:nucleoid-associated protein YgaU